MLLRRQSRDSAPVKCAFISLQESFFSSSPSRSSPVRQSAFVAVQVRADWSHLLASSDLSAQSPLKLGRNCSSWEFPEFFHQDTPKTLFPVHDTQEHMVFHGIESISLAKVSILLPLRRVQFVVFGDALRAQLVPDVVTNGEIRCTCTASEFQIQANEASTDLHGGPSMRTRRTCKARPSDSWA